MYRLKVLICDDMEHVRLSNEHHVKACGEGIFNPLIESVASVEEGMDLITESIRNGSPFDIAFLDIDFSGPQSQKSSNGFEAANFIRNQSPSTTIVMISAYSTEDNLMIAEQSPHVFRFFRRGEFTQHEMKNVCLYSLMRRLHAKGELLPSQDVTFTRAPVMLDYLQKVDQVGPEHNVVIYGETGTGKELTAKRLNVNARVATGKAARPLVVVNCGGLTDTLWTSELFGYVKGAFTGANQDTAGLLEKAEGGDIFFDELQNAPLKLQEILMRVLQDKVFSPVGGKLTRRLNVRFISALNKNPIEVKKSGALMPDLLARIQQEYLVIPALRERKGDIPALVEYFRNLDGKADKVFSDDAVTFLEAAPWPTNVRGLRNVVLEAIRHSKTPVITQEGVLRLPSVQEMLSEAESSPEIAGNKATAPAGEILRMKVEDLISAWFQSDEPLSDPVEEFEKKILVHLWREFPSISEVSRRSKLPKTTIRRKLTKYGILTGVGSVK
jgi:DNA-binding NtrC family response regulator